MADFSGVFPLTDFRVQSARCMPPIAVEGRWPVARLSDHFYRQNPSEISLRGNLSVILVGVVLFESA